MRDADLGRLALDDGVTLGLDGRRRINDRHMPVDEPVEELRKRRQLELLGRDGQLQSLDVRADVPGELGGAALGPDDCRGV